MKLDRSRIDLGIPDSRRVSGGQTEVSDQFYRRAKWLKIRKVYMSRPENALCVVWEHLGRYEWSEICDHVIRRKVGGADLDSRNFMPMSRYAHDIKRAMEGNGDLDNLVEHVDYTVYQGKKIPTEYYRRRIIDMISDHIRRTHAI